MKYGLFQIVQYGWMYGPMGDEVEGTLKLISKHDTPELAQKAREGLKGMYQIRPVE